MSDDRVWQDDARCKGMPTKWFYPDPGEKVKIARARAICTQCPVSVECQRSMQQNGEQGMWGGVYVPPQRQRQRMWFRARIVETCDECDRRIEPGEDYKSDNLFRWCKDCA